MCLVENSVCDRKNASNLHLRGGSPYFPICCLINSFFHEQLFRPPMLLIIFSGYGVWKIIRPIWLRKTKYSAQNAPRCLKTHIWALPWPGEFSKGECSFSTKNSGLCVFCFVLITHSMIGLPAKPLGENGKGKGAAGRKWGKREKGKGTRHDLSEFPPYNQSARTHARTETEIDFPVGLTPPNLRCMTTAPWLPQGRSRELWGPWGPMETHGGPIPMGIMGSISH